MHKWIIWLKTIDWQWKFSLWSFCLSDLWAWTKGWWIWIRWWTTSREWWHSLWMWCKVNISLLKYWITLGSNFVHMMIIWLVMLSFGKYIKQCLYQMDFVMCTCASQWWSLPLCKSESIMDDFKYSILTDLRLKILSKLVTACLLVLGDVALNPSPCGLR